MNTKIEVNLTSNAHKLGFKFFVFYPEYIGCSIVVTKRKYNFLVFNYDFYGVRSAYHFILAGKEIVSIFG